jgi:hypothetical protein
VTSKTNSLSHVVKQLNRAFRINPRLTRTRVCIQIYKCTTNLVTGQILNKTCFHVTPSYRSFRSGTRLVHKASLRQAHCEKDRADSTQTTHVMARQLRARSCVVIVASNRWTPVTCTHLISYPPTHSSRGAISVRPSSG